MNAEKMLYAMNEIDDAFILEADPEKEKTPIPFHVKYRRYLVMAASFSLVIGIGAYGLKHLGGTKKSDTTEAISEDGYTVAAEKEVPAAEEEILMEAKPTAASVKNESAVRGSDEMPAMEEPAQTAPGAVAGNSAGFFTMSEEETAVTNNTYEAEMDTFANGIPAEAQAFSLECDIFTCVLCWEDRMFTAEYEEYYGEIPLEFTFAGEIGGDETAFIRSDCEYFYGLPVFASMRDVNNFYVGTETGYVLFTETLSK